MIYCLPPPPPFLPFWPAHKSKRLDRRADNNTSDPPPQKKTTKSGKCMHCTKTKRKTWETRIVLVIVTPLYFRIEAKLFLFERTDRLKPFFVPPPKKPPPHFLLFLRGIGIGVLLLLLSAGQLLSPCAPKFTKLFFKNEEKTLKTMLLS